MTILSSPIDASFLPRPGDPERAALGIERWRDQARQCDDPDLADFALALADQPAGRALLEAVFGNSPFLGRCLLLEMPTVRQLVSHGPDAVFQQLLADVRGGNMADPDGNRLMQELRLARRRSVLDPSVNRFKPVAAPASVVVATAYDEAFGCYFPDTLDLLERRGARLVDFSPLRDDALPAGVDIVYIGCGRPERHAAALADNHCMRSALRAHAASGKRIYAEGGGLAYLCHHLRTESEGWLPMAGVLPAAAWLNPDPGPVTPIEIEFSRGNWLGEAGTRLRGYRNGTWSIQSQIDRDGHSPLVDYALATSQRSDLIGYRAALGSRVHLNFAAQPGALQGFFSDSLPQPSAV